MSGTINKTPSKNVPDFSEMPRDEAAASVMDMLMAAHRPETPRPDGQVMENVSPDYHDAISGVGGGTRPWSREEFEAMKHGSIGAFLELSQVAGADTPRGPSVPAPGRSLINTRMIPERLAKNPIVGYKPPSDLPQRPVEADYLKGVPADEFGLTHTPEGVPLTAQNVAGRRAVDEFGGYPDRRIDTPATVALAKDIGGAGVLGVPEKALPGGAVGSFNPRTKNIRYQEGLSPEKTDVVVTHEVGHLIDNVAGGIPHNPKLDQELKTIYHTLWTGKPRNPKVMKTSTPENEGYPASQAHGERMAEAIRAYIQDPNWIKSVAPMTAKVIRDAVNSNPDLNKWIQFNTAAGLLSGAAAADLARDTDDGEEKKGS